MSECESLRDELKQFDADAVLESKPTKSADSPRHVRVGDLR